MRYAIVIEKAVGRVRVVEDFLSLPEALAPREENVKVTLSLSRRGVDFFKRASLERAAAKLLSSFCRSSTSTAESPRRRSTSRSRRG